MPLINKGENYFDNLERQSHLHTRETVSDLHIQSKRADLTLQDAEEEICRIGESVISTTLVNAEVGIVSLDQMPQHLGPGKVLLECHEQ
jgi:hypothetical protein